MYSTPNLRYLWNSVPLLTCFTFTVWNASLFHSFDKFLTLATFSLFYTEHFTTTAKVLATFAILSSSYIQDCLCHVFTFVLTTFSSTFLNIILPLLSLLVKGLLVGNTRQPHMATSNFSSDKIMGKTWTWTHYSIPQILCSLLDYFIKSNFDNSWLELYLFFDDLCFFFTFLALLFPCL